MNIEDLTIKQARELAGLFGSNASRNPYDLGSSYLIRTVTHYAVGRVVEVTEHEIVLEQASWVADTGRFHEALSSGVLEEVEPFRGPRTIIGRGAVVDADPWAHDLPTSVK